MVFRSRASLYIDEVVATLNGSWVAESYSGALLVLVECFALTIVSDPRVYMENVNGYYCLVYSMVVKYYFYVRENGIVDLVRFGYVDNMEYHLEVYY